MSSSLFLWTAASAAVGAPWLTGWQAAWQRAADVVEAIEIRTAPAEERREEPSVTSRRVLIVSDAPPGPVPVRVKLAAPAEPLVPPLVRPLWQHRVAAPSGAENADVLFFAQAPAEERRVVTFVQAGDNQTLHPRVVEFNAAGETAAETHWRLGVATEPLPPALAAHLKLEHHGVIVAEVVPDSAAAQAGLKTHDVITAVGSAPIARVEDLQRAVEASEGKTLKIELVRAGEKTTVEVAPRQAPPVRDESHRVWTQRLPENVDGPQGATVTADGDLLVHFFGPGALVAASGADAPKLPKDVKVVVTKQGEEPSKVVVTRGQETFEGTETDLSKIPEELRPAVQRLIDGRIALPGQLKAQELQFRNRLFMPNPQALPPGVRVAVPKLDPHAAPAAVPAVPAIPAVPPVPSAVEERLKSLEKRMEDLQKSIDAALKARGDAQ